MLLIFFSQLKVNRVPKSTKVNGNPPKCLFSTIKIISIFCWICLIIKNKKHFVFLWDFGKNMIATNLKKKLMHFFLKKSDFFHFKFSKFQTGNIKKLSLQQKRNQKRLQIPPPPSWSVVEESSKKIYLFLFQETSFALFRHHLSLSFVRFFIWSFSPMASLLLPLVRHNSQIFTSP